MNVIIRLRADDPFNDGNLLTDLLDCQGGQGMGGNHRDQHRVRIQSVCAPGWGALKTNALLRGTNMADNRKDASVTEPPRIHLDPEELLLLNGIGGTEVMETAVKIGKPDIRAARNPSRSA